jgi:hypothetical protein
MEKVAAVLIAAHIIADFGLQTDSLIKRKQKIGFLLIHAAIHAALTYVLLQAWTGWQAPLLVFIMHNLIDLGKQYRRSDTATAFAVDQTAHILSLFALAWLLRHFNWIPVFSGVGFKPLMVVAGFIISVKGCGFFIEKFIRTLAEENELHLDGLTNGGKMIGQLERALIYLFILIDQPVGIGFLVAAKSILRFEEAKKEKLAEYVLIGTLLSFSLAIALAWVTRWAMRL